MVNLKKLSALLIALNFLFTGALHAATLDGQPPPFGSSAAEIRADDALEKAELYKRAPVRSVTITNPVNANAIVAVSANVPVTALVDGLEVGFVAGATITGAATFQLDSTAATAITDIAGTALATGNITSGVQYKIRYVAATSNWRFTSALPIAFTGGTVPNATTFSSAVTHNAPIIMLSGPIATPGGRLTLTTATPVLSADVTAATTVYYTPYLHNFIMLYNGTSWETRGFSEMSQALSDTTKSPAATVASNPYDVFVWDDAGTLRATRGPSWLAGAVAGSTTARGTGAGSTDIARVNGVLTNVNAITNGPAANRGVYVGSFITNASNQVDWVANPTAAAGGGNCRLNIWNMYNRVQVSAVNIDSTASWTTGGAVTRPANNSTSNRITIFAGQKIEPVALMAALNGSFQGINTGTGVGVNSTTAISGIQPIFNGSGIIGLIGDTGTYKGFPGLGVTFYQWMESTSANITVNGSIQSGLDLMWWA